MTTPTTPWKPALALSLLLLTAALAGCLAGKDDPAPDSGGEGYASFQDALDADGATFAPEGSDSPVRLKVLAPANLDNAPQGPVVVEVLLYDADANQPIEDATLYIEAEMPAMGHGTSGEEHPTHEAHGVYKGKTNFLMPGAWLVNLDAELTSGEYLEFDVEVNVGGGADTGSGDQWKEDAPTFDSFQAALDAAGHDYNATAGDGPVLRLLHPDDPTNTSAGEEPLVFLLHTAGDAPEPVTDATVTLASWMPPHDGMPGHGPWEERDPTHQGHGVYLGMTNHSMNGMWWVNLTVSLPGGESYEYALEFLDGGPDYAGGHHHHHDNSTDHDGHHDHGDHHNTTADDGGNGTVFAPTKLHRQLSVTARNGGGDYWFEVNGYDGRNPTIALIPGATYAVTVTNEGTASHNFHVGAPVDAASDSVGPGESTTFSFTVPADSAPTEYWCDPHQGAGMGGAVEAAAANASAVTLTLLHPHDPANSTTGEHPIHFTLHDAAADAPVTDATVTLESWMPEHDHGSGDEVDPVYNATSGQYEGKFNHIMEGDWEVRLNATLPGGDWYYYVLDFHVGDGGGHNHDGHDHEH